MKMRDIMKPAPQSVGKDTPLSTAERIMASSHVHFLPVVESGTLVGLLSERDVLCYRANVRTGEAWWRSPVGDAMQPDPQTAGPADTVNEIAGRIVTARIEVLPIVERGCLSGVVTATDVFDAEVRSAMTPRPEATAADAMTDAPITVAPSDSLVDAARRMVGNQIRHLPVVEDGRVVGMLSDRDLRTVAGDPARLITERQPGTLLRVRDAMTTNPTTVPADRPLTELALDLVDENVGALPVVDRDGKLIGIVSYVDVLEILAE